MDNIMTNDDGRRENKSSTTSVRCPGKLLVEKSTFLPNHVFEVRVFDFSRNGQKPSKKRMIGFCEVFSYSPEGARSVWVGACNTDNHNTPATQHVALPI
jgi:hypothetical protein